MGRLLLRHDDVEDVLSDGPVLSTYILVFHINMGIHMRHQDHGRSIRVQGPKIFGTFYPEVCGIWKLEKEDLRGEIRVRQD